MQKRILLALTIIGTVFLFSCKKETANTQNEETIRRITSHLKTQSLRNPKAEDRISSLTEALDYSAMKQVELGADAKIVIVPIVDVYKTKYRISSSVDLNLIIFFNGGDVIRKANIVYYRSATSLSKATQVSFQNILTTGENIPDGQYTFCNISGARNYELTYANGKLNQAKHVEKGGIMNSVATSSQRQKVSYVFECSDVYLVTYNYDEAGNFLYSERQFLYRQGNCNGVGENQIPQEGEGGGGGNEVPEEYEYAKSRTMPWGAESGGSQSQNTFWFLYVYTKLVGNNGIFTSVSNTSTSCQGCESFGISFVRTSWPTAWSGSSATSYLNGELQYQYTPNPQQVNKNHQFSYSSVFPN